MELLKSRFWRAAAFCLLGAAVQMLITVAAFRLKFNFATTSFCYLLWLVLQSLSGSYASSAVVAILAVGCLDYYFLDPLFSFQIDNPIDALGLLSFLGTGLVITRLVSMLRERTEASRLQRKRVEQLYDLAQQLLAIEPSLENGGQFLELYEGVLGIRAACIFDAAFADVYLTANAGKQLEERTGDAFIHGKDVDDRESGFVARSIRVGGRITGAIGFDGLEDPAFTARPLAALAAAYLERTHSFVHASRAAAAAQAESYRSAILDALAHEFKTPLSTILTAAGALSEVASLRPVDREMAETIESEASRLGQLTSRLIRTSRLEREEVKPWIELIDVYSVAVETVNQYSKMSEGRSIHFSKDCDSAEAMADPELLRLAISQLLDNACKYSTPGSAIWLRVGRLDNTIAVRILSSGNPIPPAERGRIFERFYRGTDGLRVGPGSGLGLFVARKIALALGGQLDLAADHRGGDDTEFCLTLPCQAGEEDTPQ